MHAVSICGAATGKEFSKYKIIKVDDEKLPFFQAWFVFEIQFCYRMV